MWSPAGKLGNMTKSELRIIFMGTPAFAVASLRALVEGGYRVVAVVTQPDKAVGRHHSRLQPSPVKQYATERGLPVLQPVKMRDETFINELRSYKADLQVVVAFRMLPEQVWDMPRYGTFNVHASLLPQYRGAAPINRAIINGETMTGVTTFFLDRNIDTGRIIAQRQLPISDTDDAGIVHDALMSLGADIAVETIDSIIATDGKVQTYEQCTTDIELRPAPKLFKDDCRIDWNKPMKSVYDFIRGLSPAPGAWCTMDNGGKSTTMKIYRSTKTSRPAVDSPGTAGIDGHELYIATADGLLRIDELQPEGKRRMTARDYINGIRTS